MEGNSINIYIQGFTKSSMKLSVTVSHVVSTLFGNSRTKGPTLILDTLRHGVYCWDKLDWDRDEDSVTYLDIVIVTQCYNL